MATSKEMEKISRRLDQVVHVDKEMVHAIQEHATLVKDTTWRVQENAQHILDLTKMCQRLDTIMVSLDERLQGGLRQMEEQWIASNAVSDTFSKINEAIQWLEDYQRKLNSTRIAVVVNRTFSRKRNICEDNFHCLFPLLYYHCVFSQFQSLLIKKKLSYRNTNPREFLNTKWCDRADRLKRGGCRGNECERTFS